MLLSKKFFLAWGLASLACFMSQVSAQCNPLAATCPPNPGLTKSDYYVDFTKQSSLPENWILANYATVKYGVNGAEFTFSKRHDAPYIWTNFYILFGRIEVVMQAAPGTGIVSSAVLMSDDEDEIDWEWSGNNFASGSGKVQTNYFGKGITGNYDRGTQPAVDSPQTKFHTYALDWTPSTLTWSIDGQLIRRLKAADCDKGAHQYPQTPSRLHLGVWDAGDADVHPATANWAGGYTDLSEAPFTAYVRSVKITNANPCSEYTYGDKSGDWQSIKCTNVTLASTLSISSTITSSSISTISTQPSPLSVASGSASCTSSSSGSSSTVSLSSSSSLPPASSDPAPSETSSMSSVKFVSNTASARTSPVGLSSTPALTEEVSTHTSTSITSSATAISSAQPASFIGTSSTESSVAPSYSNRLFSTPTSQSTALDISESSSIFPTRETTRSASGEPTLDVSTTPSSALIITSTIIAGTPYVSDSSVKPPSSATESTAASTTISNSKTLSSTSYSSPSTPNSAKTTAAPLKCHLDNCLRNLQDRRYASSATVLCKTYTITGTTATTAAAAGATPAAIPTWLSGCSSSAARVSSACTCLMASSSTATGSGSATTTPGAGTEATTGTEIMDRAALPQTDGNGGGDETEAEAEAENGSVGAESEQDRRKPSGYGSYSKSHQARNDNAHTWLHRNRRRGHWI